MRKRIIRKTTLAVALSLCITSLAVQAANNDGSVVGRVVANDGGAVGGLEITARNPATSFERTVRADADGSYRFPFLPVGEYVIEVRRDGGEPAVVENVAVRLGAATTVTIPIGDSTLERIEVTGSSTISMVDVSSVESAMNLSREELQRLPVDRSVSNVALLAPGTASGDPSLGGISFGGSSVAENSVYVNGLNVTDFYNRVGFSSVPYSFYQEFQVKTGGYSVEFGRTTGGVINTVTRSGTNDFHAGAELNWEPDFLQSEGEDHYDQNGRRYITAKYDEYDRTSLNVFASGAIVKDKLFFFGMYEARDYQPRNTSDAGTTYFDGDTNDAFWGGKIDWQVNDNNLVELLAFSDQDSNTIGNYAFNPETGARGALTNTQSIDSGGDNWAATWTSYLTDDFSMKLLYGENERNRATKSTNDVECNRVFDNRTNVTPTGDVGCTASALVEEAIDTREAFRLDFEWQLGDHGVRFGLDRENNTSDYQRYYPGPNGLRYDVFVTSSTGTGSNVNGVVLAPGTAYVRTRALEVAGEFETVNEAFYLEDNWQATDRLMLNGGLRMEAFDNRDGEGKSYIEIDDMIAPRLGASFDLDGDGRTKIFGNLGRYFLPVANVINIKQAGGFLDERTFYLFNGYEEHTLNGRTYRTPILGNQIGTVDNSQGNGSVADLRSKVDKDMDPVYQDELILGFQRMIDEIWSWGVRGTYRRLHNAIDDMSITSTGVICNGKPVSNGFVMANPGQVVTLWSDTNCDGQNDAYVDIDTSNAGWAIYDDNGNYVGDIGYEKPKRSYKAVELQLDRAWDGKWAMNASYTLAFSRGNAEGPVNSDTNFGDSGRTQAFDNPFVNLGGEGYLANDHRHQFKVRGSYQLAEHWALGATLNAQSGRPQSGLGVGNPFDNTRFFSNYVCVDRCGLRPDGTAYRPSERVYRLSERGSYGRTPWLVDMGASVAYERDFGDYEFVGKFAVYNLLNRQEALDVNDRFETNIGDQNPEWLRGTSYQSPRYAQLTLSLHF